MDGTLNQAWQLLSLSRLFTEDQLAKLRARLAREAPQVKSPRAFWEWLRETGVLTPFQANLFSSGLNGPFRLDHYVLLDRVSEGPLQGTFLARHATSQHPVQLDFFAAGDAEAQADWQAWLDRATRLASEPHTALVRTFEAVTVPDHAFVVSAIPVGVSLEQKVPRKARVPWTQAAAMGAQLAAALAVLQKLGLAHGGLNPRSVWLVGKSQVQLRNRWQPDEAFEAVQPQTEEAACDYQAPEVISGNRPSSSSDLYSLGCLLTRLITGRPVTSGATLDEKRQSQLQGVAPELGKFEASPALQQLVSRLLAKSPADRLRSPTEAARILAEVAGQPLEQLLPRVEPAQSLPLFLQSITEKTPVVSGTKIDVAPTKVAVAPVEEPPPPRATTPVATLTLEELRNIRRAKRRRIFLGTASSLLLFAGFLGLVAWSLTWNRTAPTAPTATAPPSQADGDPVGQASPEPGELLASEANAVVRQRVVPDDGKTLWQAPTSGRAVNLSYLPPGARIVLFARPAELLANPEGQLLFQALDSRLRETINRWSVAMSTPLAEIGAVAVALYPTAYQEYQALARITLAKPVSRSQLGDRWKVDLLVDQADNLLISRGDEAILLLPFGPNPAGDNLIREGKQSGVIESFVYGPGELVNAARDSANADHLSGPFAALNQMVDGQRHFNALFQPSGLFNDEGQWLMSDEWAPLNRYLRGVLDESTRSGLFSLHLDEGVYLELVLSHSVDKRPVELRQRLESRLRQAHTEAFGLLATMTSNPYWERVRLRFDNMLNDFFGQLRTGVERQFVIANAWLPPMAAHNLLAASELALSLGDAALFLPPDPTGRGTPQSLEELLAQPRSLAVTTNPDLNLLLQGIATEVNEQYPDLPFKFKIDLAGTDLAKEGITQNQRPGDFTAEQRPLSGILSEIMLRANPDKSARQASDPNCKLVWVIALDPANPAERLILVTTRAAALERGLSLPADFQPLPEK